jgi:hypothetical protein
VASKKGWAYPMMEAEAVADTGVGDRGSSLLAVIEAVGGVAVAGVAGVGVAAREVSGCRHKAQVGGAQNEPARDRAGVLGIIRPTHG